MKTRRQTFKFETTIIIRLNGKKSNCEAFLTLHKNISIIPQTNFSSQKL